MPSVARAAETAVPDTSAPKVASEAPVPGGQVADGPTPRVGPFVAPTDVGAIGGVWWLIGFGGLQFIGLFVITRRARAKVSASNAPS